MGLETENGVVMGGDSASSSGWDINRTRLEKVFQRGEFLIGYTTSFRMGQLLQYNLLPAQQQDEQSDLEYMATTVVDAVRDCFKDGGFQKTDSDREEGGSFLVGYNGRIYKIESDYQVNTSMDGYDAIGCGRNFALGSLWSTVGRLPEKRVRRALKTAGHFSNGVCGPYLILSDQRLKD